MSETYFYCINCGRDYMVIDCAGLQIQCLCGAIYDVVYPRRHAPTVNVVYGKDTVMYTNNINTDRTTNRG